MILDYKENLITQKKLIDERKDDIEPKAREYRGNWLMKKLPIKANFYKWLHFPAQMDEYESHLLALQPSLLTHLALEDVRNLINVLQVSGNVLMFI